MTGLDDAIWHIREAKRWRDIYRRTLGPRENWVGDDGARLAQAAFAEAALEKRRSALKARYWRKVLQGHGYLSLEPGQNARIQR